MQILLENGYVASYALVGEMIGGIDVQEPADIGHFESNYQAYKLNGQDLVFDDAKSQAIATENLKTELRERREAECFHVINRGPFWFDTLTAAQTEELRAWYKAWLNVTETLEAPAAPNWLKGAEL